jgi:long-chain fatty acid transport protein
MFRRRHGVSKKLALSFFALALGAVPAQAQIGVLFTGAGAVNRSMGGAAVAAPLDASGALYWNPATTSALPSSSIDFGAELLYPQTRLGSSVPANGFGPGIPPIGLSGSTRGDDGVFAIPSMALVYKPEDSIWTYGFGVFVVGGFGTNYPSSGTNPFAAPVNPILTPQPPFGMGLGSVYADLQILELTPTVSVQLTDRLSIGGGPTLAMANLRADPLFLATPDANGNYPPGTHSRTSWGGGFQLGAFYKLDNGWNLGASFKSPQWMDAFHFQTVDQFGQPRDVGFRFNVPMITSVGVGYTGFDRWVLAADFRYVDYRHTEGFEQSGFAPNGMVQGLGWRSVFATSLGAQYQMTDTLSVRGGYSYNQDPISDSQSSFNVASPTIIEHAVYLGVSYQVSSALSLSLAYLHGFQNSVEGPLVTPLGTVPGSSVRSTVSADALVLGVSVKFGAGCR